MPNTILAFDCATSSCSVAIEKNKKIVASEVNNSKQHSELLLATIDQLLQQVDLDINDIELFAVGKGPGSFTGIRLAISVMQALASVVNKPIAAVSTLQILAQQAYQLQSCHSVLVALDARMHEIYFAQYKVNATGVMLLQGDEQLVKPDFLIDQQYDDCVLIGSGWDLHKNLIKNRNHLIANASPQASDLISLAQYYSQQQQVVIATQLAPTYLRNKVAFKKGEKHG